MVRVIIFATLILGLGLLLAGCSLAEGTQTVDPLPALPTAAPETMVSVDVPEPPVISPTATPLPPTAIVPPAATRLPIDPFLTATPTPIPTYVYLRGKVIVDQANCRYGPGWAYLYKYGVYRDSVLEIIGRNEAGSWVLIRGVGGTNACWVKASLLEIRGEVMHVEPTSVPLPWSPYYGPLTGVRAERQDEVVTVSWNPLYLRAGDDSEQTPYIVEAWVCQAGELVFIPYGSYQPVVEIIDEWGCVEASHARVTAAEKHGYTAFVEVPWIPAEPPNQGIEE